MMEEHHTFQQFTEKDWDAHYKSALRKLNDQPETRD